MSAAKKSGKRKKEIGTGAPARALAVLIKLAASITPWVLTPITALCALSSLLLLPLAITNHEYMLALFEASSLVAAAMALLTLRGKFAQGPVLSLVCSAGAIASLAIIAEPTTVAAFFKSQAEPIVIAGRQIVPLMIARVVAGVLIGAGALCIAWSRRPERSAGYLLRSAIALLLAIGVLIPTVWPGQEPPRSGWRAPLDHVALFLEALPLLLQVLGVILAFFVVIGLVSVSGHCFIRSLEVARLDAPGKTPEPRQAPAATPPAQRA